MTAPDQPFCRRGFTCASRGWRPEYIHLHIPACPMSDSSAVHRAARIDALTKAEMRTLLNFLSGGAPDLTDIGLADADSVRELLPGHMPEGAL